MTNTIYDVTHESDVIMLVGSNPEHAHPVIGMQIRQAVEKGTRLIVADPREIDLAKKADIWNYLKEHAPEDYKALRGGLLGIAMNLPGRGGRKITIGAYRIARKFVGFN